MLLRKETSGSGSTTTWWLTKRRDKDALYICPFVCGVTNSVVFVDSNISHKAEKELRRLMRTLHLQILKVENINPTTQIVGFLADGKLNVRQGEVWRKGGYEGFKVFSSSDPSYSFDSLQVEAYGDEKDLPGHVLLWFWEVEETYSISLVALLNQANRVKGVSNQRYLGAV